MKYICKYFDDHIKECNNCDNCLIRIKRQKIQEERKLNFKISNKSNNPKQTIDNLYNLIDKNKFKNNDLNTKSSTFLSNNSNATYNTGLKVFDISENKCLKEDIIVIRYFVLELFHKINKGLGMTNLVKILKGKHTDYKDLKLSGIMKKYKIEDIKNYIRKVNHSEYISRKSIPNNDRAIYYCINDYGKNWLKFNRDNINKSSQLLSKIQINTKNI